MLSVGCFAGSLGLPMKTDLMNSRSRGRAGLILLFLAAGCADREDPQRDFLERYNDLVCELATLCNPDATCSDRELGPCEAFVESEAEQCLEAYATAVEQAEEDPAMCMDYTVDAQIACASAIAWTDEMGCEAIGRPLFHDGVQVLPSVYRRQAPAYSLRGRAGEHWLTCARMEYASVSAFNRLSTELMALGAPLAMIEATQQAAMDEVVHSRMCLAHARALLDDPGLTFARLPVAPARGDITLEQLAFEALFEGCIGEGSAAGWASLGAARAKPPYTDDLHTIAGDELRHAALSWRIVGWALERQPELGRVLLGALTRWEQSRVPVRDDARESLKHFGVLSETSEQALSCDLVRDVVRPTLERLVQTRAGEQPMRVG